MRKGALGLLALLLLLAACGGGGGGAPPSSCQPAQFDQGCTFDGGATLGMGPEESKARIV